MSVQTDADGDRADTTISVQRDLRDRLKALKPFESVTYNDLLDDMIEVYSEEKELEI